MTAINAPQDKYKLVWIIFFILGLGTLLPWNFFMTATMEWYAPPLLSRVVQSIYPLQFTETTEEFAEFK